MDRYLKRRAFAVGLLAWMLLAAACSSTNTPAAIPPALTSTIEPPQISPTPLPTDIPASATLAPSSTATNIPSLTPTATITLIPSEIIDDFGVAMVLVPAGPFTMGRQDRAPNESPAHTVTLSAYYIDKFEAMNSSFAEFLNVMGNQFEGNANWIEVNDPDLRIHMGRDQWQVDEGFENYPMNEVTWYGARAYCQWRGGRLPSEAEWEKAARGTDERTFPWGEEISCDLANYAGCVYGLVPVDSYPEGVSPYGAYNMAGNVMEWVADWYGREYYQNSPSQDPTGPESSDFKIFRGGAFINAAGNVRTTYRFAKLQVLTYVANGFRCARDVSP